MAKVYDAPSNPFKRAITHGVAAPHDVKVGSSGGSAKTGAAEGNPYSELGDLSLHQTFSGPFAGLAQYGQMNRQHQAFLKEQGNTQAAMAALQEKMANGDSPQKALMNMLTENPGHMLNLPKDLVGFLTQADAIAKAGQAPTMFDIGNGNKAGLMYDASGKAHMATSRPQDASVKNLNMVDADGNPLTTSRAGGIKPVTGATPTSTFNQDNRQQFKLDNPTAQRPFYNRATNELIYPGVNGAPPTVQKVDLPTVKLNTQDNSFLSLAPSIDRDMQQLIKLAPSIADPITGKITTLAGKLTGGNTAAVAWNAAMDDLKMNMEKDRSNYTGQVKMQVKELPDVWNDATQFQTTMNQMRTSHVDKTKSVVANAEGNGLINNTTSEQLTKMGVFSRRFEPVFDKIQNDPDSLTPAEIKALAPYKDTLPKEHRDAIQQIVTKKLGETSQQSMPTSTPAEPNE